MKLSTPFPGRRRKAEMQHEKCESPAMETRERREEMQPRRPTLRLKKRGK